MPRPLRCENPACHTKLFTPKSHRHSKRVCNFIECHDYIERRDKREWWHKNGKVWRKKWKRKRAPLDKL